jgi:protein transport protein SEC31
VAFLLTFITLQIFIWDLANPAQPSVYNPGGKTQQQNGGITCVAWNRKVQHILGSTSYNGVTMVWDLKVKRAVLSFHDPNKKIRCRAMAWNPEEATQLITASEDDNLPVIEIWDLRNTYSPLKVRNPFLVKKNQTYPFAVGIKRP